MNTMQNPRMQAEALKRMGRGPDTQLIHMTDSEIDALNGLSALVFKEPLRTNPQTGLPEAGLFKQLLPTVLAIGAGAFLGPAAAGFLAGGAAPGAIATGLGTGLAAAGGHLVGQAATGQDINFGRALLAGAGSGLTAGLTFNPAEAAVGNIAGSPDVAAAQAIDPNFSVPVESASAAVPAVPAAADFVPAAADFEAAIAASPQPALTDFIRSPSQAFDYLAAEPLKRVVAPVGVAALTGEFDAPLPEAPAGPEREPFVPQKFRATRERRDLDRDGDGEVTEEDIMEVVQELPEGQSSRFYTPMQYTPLSTGGLVNLEQGGSIKQAIQNLTGGEGSAILPMIAQAVVKPGEEEEDEATTKGYPLGTPGTPPGMPTTGIAIGGGQPPQPFQAGGGLVNLKVKKLEDGGPSGGEDAGDDDGGVAGDAESAAAGAPGPGTGTGDDSGEDFGGEFGGFGPDAGGLGAVSGVAGAAAAAEAAAEAAARDTALAVHTPKTTEEDIEEDLFDVAMALPTPVDPTPDVADMTDFGPLGRSGIAATLGGRSVNPGISGFGYQSSIGRGPFGGYTSSDKDTAQSDIDQGYETAPVGSFSVPGFLGGVAKTAASAVVPGLGLGISALQEATTPPGTGTLGALANVADPQGAFGVDTANAPASAPAAAPAPASDPFGTGFSDFGDRDPVVEFIEEQREEEPTIKMAQGGLAGIPYFEGRVMPTGDPREDGMSDNIPFVIAGQEGGQMGMQPAILSPDEYVIPADVVSMLGNGSSTAGSNQLDQFISNFRMEKYGRPKQPPEMRGGLNSLA